MGSKPPALWQSEPANPKGFARRIPSIGCVMTHPHLLTILPAGKMTQMSLQGDTPPAPVNAELHPFPSPKQEHFCQKSNTPDTAI